jgi:hypothetical protein
VLAPLAEAAEKPAVEKPAKKAAAKKPAEKKASTRAVNKGETCAKDGCDGDARARGLCSKHHTAWYRENVPGAREAARAASAAYAERKRAEKAAGVQA